MICRQGPPIKYRSGCVRQRHGLTQIEIVLILSLVGLLAAVTVPAILSARERSRMSACQRRTAQLGIALNAYHDVFNCYPPAAIWRSGPLDSLALHTTRRIDIVTYDNWALLLLPYLDQQPLASQWHQDLPIASPENAAVRELQVSQFLCPADSYNRPDNPYRLEIESTTGEVIQFSRGNYGYNAGPELASDSPGSPSMPGDYPPLVEIDIERGLFRDFGSGMGGINHCMSRDGFINGAGTMIALEELRAGIDPADPRGVWSFGQVGGSITRAHGVVGDDWGPNNQWHRSDDIRGCADLHRRLGKEFLTKTRMPCVRYLDSNAQATARSLHAGGVNVLFLDGHVRFVNDHIDPSVWHVLHHRETPSSMLDEPIEQLLTRTNDLMEASKPESPSQMGDASEILENTVGMRFILIPAATFVMGVADATFGPPPQECPAHRVTISQPYWLANTEVTQQQYLTVMGRNPSHNNPESVGAESTMGFPVDNVSWFDARAFCDTLSLLPEEQAAGHRYRLPTEAEWEFACRGGNSQEHQLPTEEQARLTGEAAGTPINIPVREVGQFPANAFGVHDLRGNLWEWCQDWHDRDYYSRAPQLDPQGPASGFMKLARGSDWIFVNMRCMNNVQVYPPWKSSPLIGFRVICERVAPAK